MCWFRILSWPSFGGVFEIRFKHCVSSRSVFAASTFPCRSEFLQIQLFYCSRRNEFLQHCLLEFFVEAASCNKDFVTFALEVNSYKIVFSSFAVGAGSCEVGCAVVPFEQTSCKIHFPSFVVEAFSCNIDFSTFALETISCKIDFPFLKRLFNFASACPAIAMRPRTLQRTFSHFCFMDTDSCELEVSRLKKTLEHFQFWVQLFIFASVWLESAKRTET
jgi:hypothetical protein